IREDGRHRVIASEGGNMDFSPHDELDDRLMAALRRQYGDVSAERVISVPGLRDIYEAIAESEAPYRDDRDLWQAALESRHTNAPAALHRIRLCLAAFTGQ